MSDEQYVRAIPAPASGGHMVIDAMHLVGYNWYSEEMGDAQRAHMEAEFINGCINAVIKAKITNKELMVVKTATNEHAENHINVRTFYCSNCHTHTERKFRYARPGSPRTVKFCPGCGARIVQSVRKG